MGNSLLINFSPSGDIHLPSSKSLGHRALICAGLAAAGPEPGESILLNAGAGLSEDLAATCAALPCFGAEAELRGGKFSVRRAAGSGPKVIDCGESGSSLRFLLPLAAVLNQGRTVFTGRGRLLERPLTAYAEIFAGSGLEFQQNQAEVSVEGRLKAGHYHLPGNVSSQFVSGLLLALPLTGGDSVIELTTNLESAPYVDLTLEVMNVFGINVERPAEKLFFIPGRQHYRPATYRLEADYSQAAFFLAAGALGCSARCHGLNPDSLQGDRAIIDIVSQMGAEITWSEGTLAAKSTDRLKALTIDAREIPDLVPVLAALGALAEGVTRIINAGRLRLKESDRLHAMFLELNKLGTEVHEETEALIINGKASLPGGVSVESHNDHRVAMALAVASLGCLKPIMINGSDCVNKSYPLFWDDFGRHQRTG